ncbi:MAG: hypothetical protein R6U95_00210, partial [Bacteroidales bacterium]
MKLTFPHIIRFFAILLVSLYTHTLSAQILVSGTTFEPQNIDLTKDFYADNEIMHYGLQPDELTSELPLTPDTEPNTFNGASHYAITNNANLLDEDRYIDNGADNEWMLAVSGNSPSGNHILEYHIPGLEPGSDVEIVVEYCSAIDPTYADCSSGRASFRGVVNPDTDNNSYNGQESPQLNVGECDSFSFTQASSNSRVVQGDGFAHVYLNTMQAAECKAVLIKSVEIYGIPKPEIIIDQGTEVCAGEQIMLQTTLNYNAAYQWEVNDGSGWSSVGTNKSQLYETTEEREYQFRVTLTPEDGSSPIVSDPIIVDAITCCEVNGAPASREVVYYDDFGRFDLDDPYTLHYTDYSDITNPVEKTRTITEPFRYPLDNPPIGHVYAETGPPQDSPLGEYFVAANFTTWGAGSDIDWAQDILGRTDSRTDHSGTAEGAMLFVNVRSDVGDVIYERTIDDLCPGIQLFFECYIGVFTTSQQQPVNITIRLSEVGDPSNEVIIPDNIVSAEGASTANPGVWVRVPAQLELNTGTSLKLEILNNNPNYEYGNDLVLDDIKIMACAPPSIELFFDETSLDQEIDICEDPYELVSKASDMLIQYYGNSPYYLFQWSQTPDDLSSWENMNTPQSISNIEISDLTTEPSVNNLENDDTVYYRVIAATQGTFTDKGNFETEDANPNDPCKNYTISEPIEATLNCPSCVTPRKFNITTDDADSVLCAGQSTLLSPDTVQANTDDFDFTWYKDSLETTDVVQATEANVNTSTYTVDFSEPGNYILLVRDKNMPSAQNCWMSDSIQIDSASTPT